MVIYWRLLFHEAMFIPSGHLPSRVWHFTSKKQTKNK